MLAKVEVPNKGGGSLQSKSKVEFDDSDIKVVILDGEVEDLEDENHSELNNFNASSSSKRQLGIMQLIVHFSTGSGPI